MTGEGGNTYTFVLEDEDHTIGATLVDVLNQRGDVVFAGYTIPHPSERKVQLCVQTNGEISPQQALAAAAESLSSMCASTKVELERSLTAFKESLS